MKIKDRYCLLRFYDGGFIWEKIPEGATEPKVGDESDTHDWMPTCENSVVIAVLDEGDPGNGLLGLEALLAALVEKHSDRRDGFDGFVFHRMLDSLMQHAVEGVEKTATQYAEIKKRMTS